MRERFITMTFAILFSVFGFTAACWAETYPVSSKDPIADITIPDSWLVKNIARGLQGATKDEEVYLWAEVYPADGLNDIMAEHDAYYTKQGVEIASGDPKTNLIEVNGVPVVLMHVSATWKGKPTVVEYAMFEPARKTGRKLMVSYWTTPKGDKMYEPDLTSILASIKMRAQ